MACTAVPPCRLAPPVPRRRPPRHVCVYRKSKREHLALLHSPMYVRRSTTFCGRSPCLREKRKTENDDRSINRLMLLHTQGKRRQDELPSVLHQSGPSAARDAAFHLGAFRHLLAKYRSIDFDGLRARGRYRRGKSMLSRMFRER